MPARLSSSSLADQASQIQTVGLRPIQKVISGALYSLESCSKYIHGLLSGRRCVFPIMGRGSGPGGYPSNQFLFHIFLIYIYIF